MAPTPLAIGKKPVQSPPGGDAAKSSGGEKVSINQSGKISFPHVMKKAKADSGDKGDKSTDAPAVGAMVQHGHAADATLPPNGTMLPPELAHAGPAAAPGQSDQPNRSDATTGDGSGASAAVVNGMPFASVAAKGIDKGEAGNTGGHDSKSLAEQATPARGQGPQGRQPSASVTPVADPSASDDQSQGPSQGPVKADFNSILVPLQHNQASAQAMQQDPAGSLLDKHGSLLDNGNQVGLNPVGGLNHMAHGPDRAGQTAASAPPISVPLKSPDWGDEVGGRVMWMVQHDVQTANIKINPPHLGPLEVQVSMHKDQVDVAFHSHHAGVKEALDASMPKLKEMLGSSGLQLGDANVTQHSFTGQGQYNHQGSNQHNYSGAAQEIDNPGAGDNSGAMAAASPQHWLSGSGAIDYYA